MSVSVWPLATAAGVFRLLGIPAAAVAIQGQRLHSVLDAIGIIRSLFLALCTYVLLASARNPGARTQTILLAVAPPPSWRVRCRTLLYVLRYKYIQDTDPTILRFNLRAPGQGETVVARPSERLYVGSFICRHEHRQTCLIFHNPIDHGRHLDLCGPCRLLRQHQVLTKVLVHTQHAPSADSGRYRDKRLLLFAPLYPPQIRFFSLFSGFTRSKLLTQTHTCTKSINKNLTHTRNHGKNKGCFRSCP